MPDILGIISFFRTAESSPLPDKVSFIVIFGLSLKGIGALEQHRDVLCMPR
jgi:hypothetical protein